MNAATLSWQQGLWRRLSDDIRAQRIPHALLISGIRGIGKRALAERLTQTLLCLKRPPEATEPCGDCRSCRQFSAATHPDYCVLEPGDSGAIKIDEIRRLSEFFQRTKHLSGYKIACLVRAEQMTVNAANALLKTLEEPPERCVLVLLCDRPSGLPATVRSRCRALALTRPDPAAALDWLRQQPVANRSSDPERLLALTAGAPLAALELANGDDDAIAHRQRLFEHYVAAVSGGDAGLAATWLRGDARLALGWLISWLQDIIRLLHAPGVAAPHLALLGNPDLAGELTQLINQLQLPPRRWFELLDMAQDLHKISLSTVQLNNELQLDAFFAAHRPV